MFKIIVFSIFIEYFFTGCECEFKKLTGGVDTDVDYDVLFFQECNLINECSKMQKVYFDGEKTRKKSL